MIQKLKTLNEWQEMYEQLLRLLHDLAVEG